MVDVNQANNTGNDGIKIKSFVSRTPSLLKSKFLSVLGNSNDFLTEFTNKLDVSLSLSTSTDTESEESRWKRKPHNDKEAQYDDEESLDENALDFELKRIKERRAQEEVLMGKYRHPNFSSRITPDDFDLMDVNLPTSSSFTNSCISKSNLSLSTNCEEQLADTIAERLLNMEERIERCPEAEDGDDNLQLNLKSDNKADSNNASLDSTLSSESQSEDYIITFMRRFVDILFKNPAALTLEIKSEFGQLAATETGRLWFSRYINSQRIKSKRVDETTFFSLVQHFAIVLFECGENDDFSPAKNLMNMCFTFYHEIDVPGCEPYREYLYSYLRDQPIWRSIRFWNAAFFDALQNERAGRPVPVSRQIQRKQTGKEDNEDENDDDDDSSSSQESPSWEQDILPPNFLEEYREDLQFQRNITFGQLGTFTCNMHAFGLSRTQCMDFLRKQCTIANLTKDQEKTLCDNINRMYRETERWQQ